MTNLRRVVGAVLLVAWAGVAHSATADIPFLSGRVVDNANVLTAETRERLSATLKAHEHATGNQVVVLTVPTIQPEAIEDYAVKVFESWKLGQKTKDNGVLVVVVPDDRKMRIEVGYGLEGVLTDGTCGEIIRAVMTPRFKTGDYDAGIENGALAVIARLEGRSDMPGAVSEAPASNGLQFEAPNLGWSERILLGAFIFGILGLFTAVGVMTPGVGWFLYVFLIPFWAMFPIVIVGTHGALFLLATYVLGYPIVKVALKRTAWYAKAARDLKTKGSASIGGFTFASSGSSSSSFSSGGGFSGGGGSSGGGGASGSW